MAQCYLVGGLERSVRLDPGQIRMLPAALTILESDLILPFREQ